MSEEASEYKCNCDCYSVLSLFSNPLPLGSLFSFILHLFLHLYPTRGQLMAQADTCPISLLQKSLEDGYKDRKVLFRGHFLINAANELATEHSMLWQQLSLRYFWVLIFLVRLWCTSLSLELLGRPLWSLGSIPDLRLAYPRRYSSSDSDFSCSRPKPHALSQSPKPNCMIQAHDSTIAPQNSGFFLSPEEKSGVLNSLRVNST